MNRLAAGLAGVVALALVAAGAALSQAGQGEPIISALPSSKSVWPHGLAAAWELLRERGAAVARRGKGDPVVAGAAAVLLIAPRAPHSRPEVASLLAEAEEGATVVVALDQAAQPEILAALGLTLAAGEAPRMARGLAPHRLVGDLALPARSAGLEPSRPGPLPVSGGPGWASAVSVPAGRGELLIFSGPEALENAHLLEGDAVSLLVRLSRLGPVVFDERFLVPMGGGGVPATTPALVLVAGQLLLAGSVLAFARGRRLGAVRPPPPSGAGRTARDYLASLAELYRRAGAEQELAATAWIAFRRRLELRFAIPARLGDAEAARRAAVRSGRAALAIGRGSAARAGQGAGMLLEVMRAAADAEAALGARRGAPGWEPRRAHREHWPS